MKESEYEAILALCDDAIAKGQSVPNISKILASSTSSSGLSSSPGMSSGTPSSGMSSGPSPSGPSPSGPSRTAPGFKSTASFETVNAIYHQQYQRYIRRTFHKHRDPRALQKYVQAFERGDNVWSIASRVNFSCYLLARLLMAAILGFTKSQVSKAVKDLSLIPHERLREEVAQCIRMDAHCSPFIDRVKNSMGAEYEMILQATLSNRGIPYETEDDLRKRGFAKTPDVKLTVPIGVEVEGEGARIVNWIDSKAMFGDKYTHKAENEPQLNGYVNRFGPGMVIYWHGFIDVLNTSPDVLLVSEFPAVCTLPGAAEPSGVWTPGRPSTATSGGSGGSGGGGSGDGADTGDGVEEEILHVR